MSFVTLHVLNLSTTLTPATALNRINTAGALHFSEPALGGARKVDVSDPQVAGALDRLAAAWLLSPPGSLDNATQAQIYGHSSDLLVQISPPIYIHVAPRSKSGKSQSDLSPGLNASQVQKERDAQNGQWEAFLTAWTRLVGDPVLSKTISLSLILSLTLNAVLLRGIATGATGQMLVSSLASVVPAVRFSAANLGVVKEEPDTDLEQEWMDEDSNEMEKRLGRSRIQQRKKPIFGLGRSLSPIKTGLANASSEIENVKAYGPEQRETPAGHAPPPQPQLAASEAPVAIIAIPPTRLVQPQPIRPDVNPLPLDLVDRKLEQVSKSSDNRSVSLAKDEARPFEACLDIFENGPRPVQESLKLLNDEEVIVLSQAGKIQPYALEKMLGDFERAVQIRRALICEYSYKLRKSTA